MWCSELPTTWGGQDADRCFESEYEYKGHYRPEWNVWLVYLGKGIEQVDVAG